MKTKAICSFFVLFALAAVVVGTTTSTPAAFAEVTIEPSPDSGSMGCENTSVGCFVPSIATVDVGEKVIFSNTDDTHKHTFSSGLSSDNEAGTIFGGEFLNPGESEEWIPDTVGEFPYFCMIHPWETGMIIVQEAEAEETPVETPSEETPVETPSEETPVETPSEETPVETPSEETPVETPSEENGGCLIATAAFGSEMAPQVQQLRELRDNTILKTGSGMAFMTSFNQFYYSFSPAVADLEREHPLFKEAVKMTLTPMLSTLSLLNHADIDSEEEILGYGIGVILLNLGMYVGLPVVGIVKLYQFRRN